MDSEFELVRNAFYTEPKDQSAWIYHRWLINQVCLNLPLEEQKEILERELGMCNELKDLLEKDEDQLLQKWPIFTNIFIWQKLGGHQNEVKESLEFLSKVDPTHQNHYLDLNAKLK